ncbi:MAG: DUF421 domain-containing protein [Clostridiales bacterium]|nr:DUF421 domain-containing protein [Clostridiales bacterium]
MANVFLRTVILYVFVLIIMRITGKRQIGQLELTEFVTAFMISEYATQPVSNSAIPLLYGVIPCVALVSLEVIFSFVNIKSRFFKRFTTGNALALIRKGKIDRKQMENARISFDELTSAMRLSGLSSLSDVEYAFLEPNGNISVIPKTSSSPPSAKDLNANVKECGVEHSVITDGKLNVKELSSAGESKEGIYGILSENGFESEKDVLYMGIDDTKNVYVVKKDGNALSLRKNGGGEK